MEFTWQQQEMNSVDLTEDGDSRETIVSSEQGNPQFHFEKQYRNFPMERFSASSPPPLTPIPRFDCLERPQDHRLYNVPKLTKIQEKSSTQQSPSAKKVQVISSTVIKPMESISLGDSRFDILQNEVENPVSIINCSMSQNPPGKRLKIMKNQKIYEYVIPHNVMPNTNQTSGPVLINIPEVGSLVISIDPHAKNQMVPKSVPLEPFSLNFDEIIEASDGSFNSSNTPYMVPTETSTFKPVTSPPCSCCAGNRQVHSAKEAYISRVLPRVLPRVPFIHSELLTDKAFCWQYSKRKRRNQRRLKDLLGFSKVELRNTIKCSRLLDYCIDKKRGQLLKQKELLESLQTFSDGKNQQMVDNSLKDKLFVKSTEHSSNGLRKPVRKRIPKLQFDLQHTRLPSNSNISPKKSFDDLLVTKKVVILNDQNMEMPEKNENSYSVSTRKRKSKQKHKLELKPRVKPCYINMTRNPFIDQMYIDLMRTLNSPKKSSHTFIKQFPISDEEMFLSKLIDTVGKFRTEMALIKPILVLNEFNYTIVKYSVEFSKSNIVFAINKERHFPNCLLRDAAFVIAVRQGFVKLVDLDILCSYFKGKVWP